MRKRSLRNLVGFIITAGSLTVSGIALSGGFSGSSAATAQLPGLLISQTARQQHLATLEASAPAAEAAVLQRGPVTKDDYLGAVNSSIACFRQSVTALANNYGLSVAPQIVGPTTSYDGFTITYSYNFNLAGIDWSKVPPNALRLVSDTDRSCRSAHTDAVEDAYHWQLRSDSTYVQGINSGFLACMGSANAGANVGNDARSYLLNVIGSGRAVLPAEQTCLRSYPSVSEEPTLTSPGTSSP